MHHNNNAEWGTAVERVGSAACRIETLIIFPSKQKGRQWGSRSMVGHGGSGASNSALEEPRQESRKKPEIEGVQRKIAREK